MKRALITGVTGQDGSLIARSLLADGYEVHGVMRRASTFNTARIDDLYVDPHKPTKFKLHFGDMSDLASIQSVLAEVQPDEIFHMAAQSHVSVSFALPIYTVDIGATGTFRLLEAVLKTCPKARVLHAASSEMFGSSPPPQSESTPFAPRSPYAIAKVAAYYAAQHYRDRGLWVANAITFNHESIYRGETFVTRKVTRAVGRIACGLQDRLYLGNLKPMRDWTCARDCVRGFRLILAQDKPDDFVLASGESHSVREMVEIAFSRVGLDWRRHVHVDPAYFRPTEVDHLHGDARKAERMLGWKPTKRFVDLIAEMVDHDVMLAKAEAAAREHAPTGRVV